MIRIPCLLAATSLFLFSSSGCSSLSLPRFGENTNVGVSSKPARCLCLWQPVNSEDAAGQPMRGFGGQVYFFAADSEKPIEVNGDVRVFVFDDIGTPTQQARPKDVQDFDSFAWQSFLTESQFGTNYTVFLPYAQASKYESICSLKLRLVQPDGTQLFSDMATVKLSGKPREDKSIRQLVSPREHSINSERSRELRVDLQRRGTSNRAATIGSIQEGSLSRRSESEINDQHLDEHAQLRIQRYEAQLAQMHGTYTENGDRSRPPSRRTLESEISDLMPDIQRVSHGNTGSLQRVKPAAHEVFSTEKPQCVLHADYNNPASLSSVRSDDSDGDRSEPTSQSNPDNRIRNFSRPLSRHREPSRQPT